MKRSPHTKHIVQADRVISMPRHLLQSLWAACLILILTPTLAPVQAQVREPLKMEGRQTLFQRVITRTGATLRTAPQPTAQAIGRALDPFTLFYVYERSNRWLNVGPNARSGPTGWIEADKSIDWKQSIVVAFNNPASFQRERTLLFKNREAMDQLIHGNTDVVPQVQALRTAAAEGSSRPDFPVVSIEPKNHIDIDQSFYLLPILNAERQLLHGNVRGRYLEIASITKQETPALQSDPFQNFKAGIVFVIDTTISMDPYIDRTRKAMERIRTVIERSDVKDRVRFGLVGFRQDMSISPRIEYHTKTFLKLSQTSSAQQFSQAIQNMKQASVPTPGFDEDSIGGIVEGVEGSDWSGFGARFIILITDAGPRPVTMGHVRSPMLPEQVNSYLKESRGIIPFAIHLKTPAGRNDHAYAERSYRAISATASGSNYSAIDNGDLDGFQNRIDALAEQIIDLTNQSMRGVVAAPRPDDNSDSARLQREWRALQLVHLGRAQGERAPDVFRAWMIDRSLDDPAVEALDVRVVLTRNQLATLRDVARSIVDKAEGGLQEMDSRSFFTQLREAVAIMARDPTRLARADFETLGDALGEYLRDLPYDSPITSITEQDWMRRTGPQQRALIETLKSKIEFYERIYNTPQKWISLHDGLPDGERVTTLPLRQMP